MDGVAARVLGVIVVVKTGWGMVAVDETTALVIFVAMVGAVVDAFGGLSEHTVINT